MKKRITMLILTITLLLCVLPFAAFADVNSSPVAKVGDTGYETIDEAIAKWTNGTTLTLLSNVTLSDTIELYSTEHHILDLGTYTMTAASGKNAIEIIASGAGSSEKNAITIKADSSIPGGINAGSKSVIYYDFLLTFFINFVIIVMF